MAITINGSANTVAGLAVGGLPDGVIDNGCMADNAIDSTELAAGAVDLAHLSSTGTAGSGNYLRGDNSWQAAGGDLSFGGDTFGGTKQIGATDAQHFYFMTNDKNRLFLRSDGHNEFSSKTFHIRTWNAASSSTEQIWCSSGGTEGSYGLGNGCMYMTTNGDMHNTNNDYGGWSDSRLKENIVDASSQWNDIKNTRIRKYNFRDGNGFQTHTQIGVIAQELETVSPGLVTTAPATDGAKDASGNVLTTRKTVSYTVLYMKAVKALQEAMTRIETLEAKVATLEGG